ncbi:MAG: hypothetical protein JWM40_2678 [Frankiales bacterium]|nr:hypothetical protein [Frankiales bacterium]
MCGVALAGCRSSPTAAPSPVTTTTAAPTTPAPVLTTATPSAVPAPVWVVGASPLPIGPDGFGKVLPTPKVLRDRHLPTTDVLPPPADGRFHASSGPITPSLRTRMGDTYRAGCPVGLEDLSYLTLTFRGFDKKVHTGELVVATSVSAAVTRAFRRLFDLGFPLEEMRLPTTGDVTAKPTGDGNDTAGFVCRAARGQKRFSAHAYGLAIDVNPFQNPYVKGDLVLPELASAYRDRTWVRDGMFLLGSAAVKAFTREGWTWGGTFSRPKDYQHMSKTGN